MRDIGKSSLAIGLVVALLAVLSFGVSVGMSRGDEGMPWVTVTVQFDSQISASCLEKGMINPGFLGEGSGILDQFTISDPDGVQIQLDTRPISSCWSSVVTLEAEIIEKDLNATLNFEPKIQESCLGTGMLHPSVESGDPSAITDRITIKDGAAQFKLDISSLSECWIGIVTFEAQSVEEVKD